MHMVVEDHHEEVPARQSAQHQSALTTWAEARIVLVEMVEQQAIQVSPSYTASNHLDEDQVLVAYDQSHQHTRRPLRRSLARALQPGTERPAREIQRHLCPRMVQRWET